jgi:hypothetical protein
MDWRPGRADTELARQTNEGGADYQGRQGQPDTASPLSRSHQRDSEPDERNDRRCRPAERAPHEDPEQRDA